MSYINVTRWGLYGSWLACFLGSMSVLSAGTKVLPVLNHPIADRSGVAGVPLTVNLASAFGTEAIDDQVVRFTSQFNSGGVPIVMDMALFSNRTPVTRQNFLKYVTDGDYVDSFIHRSVSNFVIQGGGFRLDSFNNIEPVPTDAPIVNEFGVSNTLGTISMAKVGGNPNSATSQWFVSLGANSDILDPQNGGFTVFGRMTRSTFGNAQLFGNQSIFPTYNYDGGALSELPLYQASYLLLFPSVSLVNIPVGEAGESSSLTYTVVSNNNPTVATAAIQSNGILQISPVAGKTGAVAVTVRATDSVGNTVDDSFSLTVIPDTYALWASRNSFSGGQSAMAQNPDRDGWNNLQEYAFLGNPAVADLANQSIIRGTTGSSPYRYQTLTFPVRKSAQDLTYSVEANDSLSGIWTEIWKTSDGFDSTRVVSAVDQADRTVVTIKDSLPVESRSKRFMRIKVVQQ